MTTKQNNLGIKNTAIKNGKVCVIVNYYDENGKRFTAAERFFNADRRLSE